MGRESMIFLNKSGWEILCQMPMQERKRYAKCLQPFYNKHTQDILTIKDIVFFKKKIILLKMTLINVDNLQIERTGPLLHEQSLGRFQIPCARRNASSNIGQNGIIYRKKTLQADTGVFMSRRMRQYLLCSEVCLNPGRKSARNLRTAARCCGSLEINAASRNNDDRIVST